MITAYSEFPADGGCGRPGLPMLPASVARGRQQWKRANRRSVPALAAIPGGLATRFSRPMQGCIGHGLVVADAASIGGAVVEPE